MNRPLICGLVVAQLLADPFGGGWSRCQAWAGEMEAQPVRRDATPPPQIPRDSWKDCTYNNKLIRCQDQQQPDVLRILWIDGVRSSFVRRPAVAPGLPSYWSDRYGGLWRRELLPPGNTVLTHLGSGNRIFIPLRLTCQPPLKGEVGYCRY